MSIQLGIKHILASHPDGIATVASINADMRMLSGADWSRKLRELGKRSGPINIFSDGLVERVASGWRLTDAGRQLLASLEAAMPSGVSTAPPTVIRLVSSQDSPAVLQGSETLARVRRSLHRLVRVR